MMESDEPEELNEYQPKSIKFPRFEKKDTIVRLTFYKTSLSKHGNHISVSLQKQVVLGVEIADHTPLRVYDKLGITDEFSHIPKINLESKFVEAMLRSIIIDKLRNATPSNNATKGRK